MQTVIALAPHTGIRLAEIGFLLFLVAGIWLVVATFPRLRLGPTRTIGAGLALAVGALLLIIATHWGDYH